MFQDFRDRQVLHTSAPFQIQRFWQEVCQILHSFVIFTTVHLNGFEVQIIYVLSFSALWLYILFWFQMYRFRLLFGLSPNLKFPRTIIDVKIFWVIVKFQICENISTSVRERRKHRKTIDMVRFDFSPSLICRTGL